MDFKKVCKQGRGENKLLEDGGKKKDYKTTVDLLRI